MLNMLRMRAVALGALNICSENHDDPLENHDDPPTLTPLTSRVQSY